MSICETTPDLATDHFDSPSATANPQAEIGDIYAWTAPEDRSLNLAMTVVGHSFSDRLRYVFHIDSGKAFGHTSASTTITCHFPAPKIAVCRVGAADWVQGDASNPEGLLGHNAHFRLFAGLRDDPFYNNVKGSLAAYGVVAAAVKSGAATVDAAGCAQLPPGTAQEVARQWQHTDGGPATNLLANWTASAILITVDLSAVAKGGPILAVWGAIMTSDHSVDRMARPFVGNTLLGASPFSGDKPSGEEREQYNRVGVNGGARFVARIEKSLAFQDSLDGVCANQFLANKVPRPAERYVPLERILAD